MKKLWLKFKLSFKMIRLVDKFLMLFMLILLVYSAFNLFAHEEYTQDTNAIDVIVRTSAAAIFGYFLSSNFTKGSSSGITRTPYARSDAELPPRNTAEPSIKNQIGFQTSPDASTEKPGNADFHPLPSTIPAHCDTIQVIVVSAIGGCSLLFLLILRNYVEITPEITATASQLRDFVSACIGYLVSCGKSHGE